MQLIDDSRLRYFFMIAVSNGKFNNLLYIQYHRTRLRIQL
jgi:hypothetical protein